VKWLDADFIVTSIAKKLSSLKSHKIMTPKRSEP